MGTDTPPSNEVRPTSALFVSILLFQGIVCTSHALHSFTSSRWPCDSWLDPVLGAQGAEVSIHQLHVAVFIHIGKELQNHCSV